MAAFDAAGVATSRHLFAPEASGAGHVFDGQLVALQDLVAIQVGHRHLGGGDEPEILDRVVVQVVAELGQVAGAHQGLAPDHVGRQDFGIAVAAGVQVQHEADERPLQPRAPIFEDVEA